MVPAEVANRAAMRSSKPESQSELQSQAFSALSPSSSYEEEGEENGGDDISLSTCSMSTNPTPDNPLYASRGVAVVPTSVKEHTTVVDEQKVAATITKLNDMTDAANRAVEEIIRTTIKLEINDGDRTEKNSNPNYRNSIISEDYSTSCLSSSGIATAGLHEDFNKSPEPILERQMQHNSEQRMLATSGGKDNFEFEKNQANIMKSAFYDDSETDDNKNTNYKRNSYKITRRNNTTMTTAADMDANESDKILQSSLNFSSPISPMGAGSPIGASFVLRNRNTDDTTTNLRRETNHSNNLSMTRTSSLFNNNYYQNTKVFFIPQYIFTKIAYAISRRVFDDANDDFAVATWLGFWAYLNVSCANLILKPIMDAVVLELGVENQPKLILASSVLAFLSSVPIGWLFEAPDPARRKIFKKMGMTRGETQGTSLALFYRFFAFSAVSYAVGFKLVNIEWIFGTKTESGENGEENKLKMLTFLIKKWGQCSYIAFFLVIHLMKLHSTSLIWGVTTEAMEYEEMARKQHENSSSHQYNRRNNNNDATKAKKGKTRLQRLSRIQFGGTLGSIWGSTLTSSLAETLHLPGLLVVSAILLEISAQLSIELGRIMQKHWEEQQIFKSTQDLASLDPSMKRSASSSSMKRVASGNTLFAAQQLAAQQQQQSMKRVASGNSIHSKLSSGSLASMEKSNEDGKQPAPINDVIDDNTFTQRLLRGVTTILSSRLLMTIFTYNALFSSINTLLSFQRAELVANRKKETTVSADTAFLANINFVSSVAMFAVQSSGAGAYITQILGTRGSLALMPFIRLGGLIGLCWWYRSTDGLPPNLTLFLMLDEFTKVVNQAVAKPVRESLWSDMANEARYEAKPIIDVLANRWGAGSASFCVYVISRLFLFLRQTHSDNGDATNPVVLGLSPVLFLGLIVSAWWVGVSLDLGQLRARIDLELKTKIDMELKTQKDLEWKKYQ